LRAFAILAGVTLGRLLPKCANTRLGSRHPGIGLGRAECRHRQLPFERLDPRAAQDHQDEVGGLRVVDRPRAAEGCGLDNLAVPAVAARTGALVEPQAPRSRLVPRPVAGCRASRRRVRAAWGRSWRRRRRTLAAPNGGKPRSRTDPRRQLTQRQAHDLRHRSAGAPRPGACPVRS
jgi:hypothetical protein